MSTVYPEANQEMRKVLRQQSFIEPAIKNPFYHRLKLRTYDKIKIGFNCVFLMPIRVICFGIVALMAVVVSTIVTIGLSDEELNTKPLCGWRRVLRKSLRLLGRGLQFFSGFHYIKVTGKPATKQEATIFTVAPHSSFMDIFVAFTMGLPCGVSRVENSRIPVLGRIVKAMQPISVTREDSKNRVAVIDEIKKRSDPANDWPQIIIFPEGTCTNRSCLISFKPGAFLPGVPVQPVAIQYKNKFDCITWTWDSNLTAAKIFFYTFCQFHNYLEVTFLPVYRPNEAEKADAKLFASNVREKIAEHLGVPVTNHTFEDVRLMLEAKKYSLPIDVGLIEFAKIKDKLGIKYENCQDILEKFICMARKSKGKLNLEEFCKYLDLPISEPVKQVFNMYDRDKNGHVDFREFLIGLSILSQPANNEETLKMAFKLFDVEDKGFISLADLQLILHSAFSMQASEAEKLFNKVDINQDGLISFEEFRNYAIEKPEYARVFLSYHQLKQVEKNIGVEKLSKIIEQDIEECEDYEEESKPSDNETLRQRVISPNTDTVNTSESIKSDLPKKDK